MCNTVRVHYSRWRYARGCLANRQYALKGKKKKKEKHCVISWATFVYIHCTDVEHIYWTVESTLLLYCLFFFFAPSCQPSTVYGHACFGFNMMVTYYAGTVASTPPVDRARAHMKRAQDHLFKWVRARCPSREYLFSHGSNELDFGVKVCLRL